MSFTLGSDPEVLLVNAQGKFISSVGLIGGSKVEPKKTANGFVQEDNVLVEFNTLPASSRAEFIKNTLSMLGDINDIIVPLDLSVNISSSCLFDSDQLLSLQARTAGCEPDYDAWELMENDKPDLETTNLRTCGGHLHIAFDQANEHSLNRPYLVRALDLLLGVPSVLLDRDTQRRTLYGKAGAHRPKYAGNADPYDGVEYRTLSNFWLKNAGLIGWAYGAVEEAVTHLEKYKAIVDKEQGRILQAINFSDLNVAEDLINEYQLEVANG